MGAPSKAVAFIELEDYLALETASRCKHEYLDGVIYAIQGEPARGMAGGSQIHARIIRNAAFALHARLAGSACEVLSFDMRLRIDATMLASVSAGTRESVRACARVDDMAAAIRVITSPGWTAPGHRTPQG